MSLTPIDIQQKTFGPELRGYNMDEVDDFLDDVVVALKDYDQRLRDSEDRIRALEAELSTRGEDESAISRALVAAQKQADALLAEARSDAERIRAEAQGEADQLRDERDAEKMALTQDIARMRATVADMKRRIVELAGSVQSDLDSMDEAAASASEGIGSDLSPDNGRSHDYVDSAAVGDEVDPFAEPDGEVTATARPGAHLSEDDDIDYYEPDEAEIDEDEESLEADDDFDDDDLDDADVSDDTAEMELDDESEAESEADDAADDVADDIGSSRHSTERRPWERGSV